MIGNNIDPSKRRDCPSHEITYFFSWFAFWILLLNPPFGDFTNPTIQAVSVSPLYPGYTVDKSCLHLVAGAVTIKMIPAITTTHIVFRASHNVSIDRVQFQVDPVSQTPSWRR